MCVCVYVYIYKGKSFLYYVSITSSHSFIMKNSQKFIQDRSKMSVNFFGIRCMADGFYYTTEISDNISCNFCIQKICHAWGQPSQSKRLTHSWENVIFVPAAANRSAFATWQIASKTVLLQACPWKCHYIQRIKLN